MIFMTLIVFSMPAIFIAGYIYGRDARNKRCEDCPDKLFVDELEKRRQEREKSKC